MNLDYLKAFASAARHRNITKAAQELRTSQPSLSKQLKKLEETYNVKLFQRSGMGVEPTSEGMEFLKSTEIILEQLQTLERRFSTLLNRGTIRRLRVGSGYAVAGSILPKLLAQFERQHADVEVHLRSNTHVVLEQMLVKGTLDIAVSSTSPTAAELAGEPCMRLRIIAVAAKGYPLPSARELKLRGIEKLRLIIRNRLHPGGIAETLLRQMREQGQKPRVLMRCDSPEAIKTAVSRKLGVGILYEDSVKDGLTRGVFKRVSIPGLPAEAQIYVVYNKTRPLSASAAAFLDVLRTHCRVPQEVPSSGTL
jgi:LysR family transcriptional regulator, low CO2-responsive transcriptional regulator